MSPGGHLRVHLWPGGVCDGPTQPGPPRQVCVPAGHLSLLHSSRAPGTGGQQAIALL